MQHIDKILDAQVAICFSGPTRSLPFTGSDLRVAIDQLCQGVRYCVIAHVPGTADAKAIEEVFGETAVVMVEPDVLIDTNGFSSTHYFKTGLQRYLQQICGWHKVNALRKCAERLRGNKPFEYVVRCRTDVRFKTALPSIGRFNPKKLSFPNFHHWGGVNDRFCISGAEGIDVFMNLLASAISHPMECVHAERFLAWHVRRSGIPVELFDIGFNRVRPSGRELNDYRPSRLNKHKLQGKVYVDVGAHSLTRKLANSIMQHGKSYLFEPNQELANQLQLQLQNHPQVKVVQQAVSDVPGVHTFKVASTSSCSSLLPFSDSANENWVDQRHPIKSFETVKEYDVETVRLDTFMETAGIGHIDFLQIDAQGKDLDVVKSLGSRACDVYKIEMEVLSPQQPPLYAGQPGYDEVVDFMSSVGFVELSRWSQSLDRELNITFVRKDPPS